MKTNELCNVQLNVIRSSNLELTALLQDLALIKNKLLYSRCSHHGDAVIVLVSDEIWWWLSPHFMTDLWLNLHQDKILNLNMIVQRACDCMNCVFSSRFWTLRICQSMKIVQRADGAAGATLICYVSQCESCDCIMLQDNIISCISHWILHNF